LEVYSGWFWLFFDGNCVYFVENLVGYDKMSYTTIEIDLNKCSLETILEIWLYSKIIYP